MNSKASANSGWSFYGYVSLVFGAAAFIGCSERERTTSNKAGTTPDAYDKAAIVVDFLASGLSEWTAPGEIESNAGGEVSAGGTLRVLAGEPISALRYDGPWEIPVNNYEIIMEARRVDGADFFAALTFPVHSLDTCATFVAGGWGGSVTGISNIDGADAAANETTSSFTYPKGQWFTFKIEVQPKELKVWRDDAIIARVPLASRAISMRHGEIEFCAPFGLATYGTTGEFRSLRIRSLNQEPLLRRSEMTR